MISKMQLVSAQNLREWQSSLGSTVIAELVSQSGDTVQLMDSNGKEYRLKLEKLSDLDRRYVKLQEMIRADRSQFKEVSQHIEVLKATPMASIDILTKIAKDNPTATYASLWAGVAVAAALNEPERAATQLREALKSIKEQQKIDPSRHRRTLVSYYNNLAICSLRSKDFESASDEFLKAFEVMEKTPPVLQHNLIQMRELLPGVTTKNKLLRALEKLPAMESKIKMQPGWYYSLDLQPPDSLGNELPVLGIEPPTPSLELIASGTGVVCAAGHVLTVRQVVTHP